MVWWQPWTWNRIAGTVTRSEPEFTRRDQNLLLGLQAIESELGPHGIPMSVATDQANQFKFITKLPVTDWAAETLAADKKAYYDRIDTDKEHPVNRAGHLWSVVLKEDEEPITQ